MDGAEADVAARGRALFEQLRAEREREGPGAPDAAAGSAAADHIWSTPEPPHGEDNDPETPLGGAHTPVTEPSPGAWEAGEQVTGSTSADAGVAGALSIPDSGPNPPAPDLAGRDGEGDAASDPGFADIAAPGPSGEGAPQAEPGHAHETILSGSATSVDVAAPAEDSPPTHPATRTGSPLGGSASDDDEPSGAVPDHGEAGVAASTPAGTGEDAVDGAAAARDAVPSVAELVGAAAEASGEGPATAGYLPPPPATASEHRLDGATGSGGEEGTAIGGRDGDSAVVGTADLPSSAVFHVEQGSTASPTDPVLPGAAAQRAPDPATDAAPERTARAPHPAAALALPRIIAVANQKGGVGKTTTAVNLGASLAELGYRTLVVDLDPQGNATTGLGINARNLDSSIYDVLMHERPIDECIEPTSVRNLFVAPATIDLAGAEIELVPAFSREMRLRRSLAEVSDSYDFTIIDCPPSLGLLTVNGLAAATEVMVPIQCEYYALEGLSQLMRNVNLVQSNLNPALILSAIILTMYDARTKLAEQVASEVRQHFGPRVCRNVVPRTVRLSEAPSFGQPIIVFDPSSRGALSYRELAKEVSGGAPQRVG